MGADSQAKAALNEPEPVDRLIPCTDLIPKAKNYIKKLWLNRWESKHCYQRSIKLYHINPDITPFYINGLNRKDELIIHRIRIGHTRLTHSYLMEGTPLPLCLCCQTVPISIKHLMIECPQLAGIRSKYYCANDMRSRRLSERVTGPLTCQAYRGANKTGKKKI